MLKDKIRPLLVVFTERLERQCHILKQLFIETKGIHYRFTPENIHSGNSDIHGLMLFSSKVKGLAKIFVSIAFGKVDVFYP